MKSDKNVFKNYLSLLLTANVFLTKHNLFQKPFNIIAGQFNILEWREGGRTGGREGEGH